MKRIDTESLKVEHPIEEIVARYGIELRPSGRTLTGRCPFHNDGGRPNLYVYPATQSWYCFRLPPLASPACPGSPASRAAGARRPGVFGGSDRRAGDPSRPADLAGGPPRRFRRGRSQVPGTSGPQAAAGLGGGI